MTFVFRPAAAADVEDAYAWYEGQRLGLGEEFLASERQRLLAVMFAERAGANRLISARKATRRERREYEEGKR